MSPTRAKPSPRERLLAAATELFYGEGINAVGIDRIIDRAGVAKASLYSTFGSKEELVRAYLTARTEALRSRILARLAGKETPRSKLLEIFDQLGERVASPTFRGCPFINAAAEGRASASEGADPCAEHRAWMRRLLTDLARDAGAAQPEKLGRRLALLYDGAVIAGAVDRDLDAPAEARAVAEALLDAAVAKKAARA
jgi:AcrR family transcriptional regulator